MHRTNGFRNSRRPVKTANVCNVKMSSCNVGSEKLMTIVKKLLKYLLLTSMNMSVDSVMLHILDIFQKTGNLFSLENYLTSDIVFSILIDFDHYTLYSSMTIICSYYRHRVVVF